MFEVVEVEVEVDRDAKTRAGVLPLRFVDGLTGLACKHDIEHKLAEKVWRGADLGRRQSIQRNN